MCAFSYPQQIFEHVLPHFISYPLISQKFANFVLFKLIVQMVLAKEHLNLDGLKKIVNIRASLNLGLSDLLKSAFPYTIPVVRPFIATHNTRS